MSQASIPDYLKKFLPENGAPSAEIASLASAQNSTPRVSLRGRMFRFIVAGDEVSKSAGPVHVHVIGVEPGPGKFTKTFYLNPYTGANDSNSPPDCSSDDGIRPNSWVSHPQHADCQTCPKNQFGSATSRKGKPSKACADSKRLHVTKADDAQGTRYLLQVPVSSLRSLADHGRKLAEMGVEPWMPITSIEMVDAEYPELAFKVDGFVTEANMEPLRLAAEKKEWTMGRLAIQNATVNSSAMPAHLQTAMGIQPAIRPVQDVMDVEVKTPTQLVTGTPSNADVLKHW